jgi:hypothetical protein
MNDQADALAPYLARWREELAESLGSSGAREETDVTRAMTVLSLLIAAIRTHRDEIRVREPMVPLQPSCPRCGREWPEVVSS